MSETRPAVEAPHLFLDIDGVLNCHEFDKRIMCGQIHKDKVALLNWVLTETGARIVLSSAWRYLVYRGEMNLRGLEWLLRSHGILADRLVGITREDTVKTVNGYNGDPITWHQQDERGKEIAEWVRANGVRRYAVVDDLDLGIREAGHPFVQTEGKVGLTDEAAALLIELLRGKE